MNRSLLFAAPLATMLVLLGAGATPLRAQTQPLNVISDFRNEVRARSTTGATPAPTAPVPAAYGHQFQATTALGGFVSTRIYSSGPGHSTGTLLAGGATTIAGATTLIYPSFTNAAGMGVKLTRAIIGRPMVSRVTTYFLGDIIVPPLGNYDPIPSNATLSGVDNPRFYYSPYAQAVYATQPGSVDILWRPAGAADGTTDVKVTYYIASTPRDPRMLRSMYWTEGSFKGPKISLPNPRISSVYVRYNTDIPAHVSAADLYVDPTVVTTPGVSLPAEDRTIWYDGTGDKTIHAYNKEGRVFLEYLGNSNAQTGQPTQLGIEIVQIVKDVHPATLAVDIGDRVNPPDSDTALTAAIVSGKPTDSNPYLFQNIVGGVTPTYYAIRETAKGVLDDNGLLVQNSNEVLIYWMEADAFGVPWPKYYDTYVQQWPSDPNKYSAYVRALGDGAATGVQLPSTNNPYLVYQSDPNNLQSVMLPGNVFYMVVTGNGPAYALIRYQIGDKVYFERVSAVLDTAASSTLTASVGDRLTAPDVSDSTVGYVRYTSATSGTAFNPQAYINPFANGFEAAKQGAIIPVNCLPGNNSLEVWWYKKNKAPAASGFASTYWPSFVRNYTLSWPSNSSEIVLASNAGSGDLDSLAAAGSIYYQNDPAKIGYNPNEEHALMLNGRAWALRDDLNVTATSSQPYVLVSYVADDTRPAMKVFHVLREKGTAGTAGALTFNYTATAPVVLQSPMPLPLLPIPVHSDSSQANYRTPYNHEVVPATPSDPAVNYDATRDATAYAAYQGFTYVDRKGTHWVYRGPHGTGTPGFDMQYYYYMQDGFNFPGITQPATGTVLPYLRPLAGGSPVGDAVTGTPLNIRFTPAWLASAPEMRIGQSLTLPAGGLPQVRGQSSARIVYEQSIAQNMVNKQRSVRLLDPTRAKTYPLSASTLAALPGSVKTSDYLGKKYFPNLPPHLSQRFYFDPAVGPIGSLVLIGQFVNDPVGDKYLLLNVLSSEDLATVQALCGADDTAKVMWNAAIGGLSTAVQTFAEDTSKRGTFKVNSTVQVPVASPAEITNDMTAVDSYALSTYGDGTGFVVMAFGDGQDTDFQNPGEPVSLVAFKVNNPLNRGQMKAISPSNPLDEKFTMQHSGDFSGAPERYTFEWRYAPPVDGAPPSLYVLTPLSPVPVSGGNWTVYDNPSEGYTTLRTTATPTLTPSATISLPGNVLLNDGNGAAANGTTLPNAVMRRTFSYADTARPLHLYLSFGFGDHDSAVVYLNNVPVVNWHQVGLDDTPEVSNPGTGYSPLTHVFEITPDALMVKDAVNTAGTNVLTVDFYTTADINSRSPVDVRLEGSRQQDESAANYQPVLDSDGSPHNNPRYVIGNDGIKTMTDNYYVMRYHKASEATSGYQWSQWTDPQLAEGWIKRALRGINPFQQRVTDLFNNTVDTQISLIEQAGKRYEGDIALNLSNINSVGLIETYETILNRGKGLSINGAPQINYGGANDALLLVGGYLSDLYMALGNEAYANAANPTIAFGTTDATFGNVATSLFAFKGQAANVLEQELDLLRGRDDFLQPGTRIAPVYNRLYWNYTLGIASGEVVYALNYNIKDTNSDGVVNAADAAMLYPQAHGDAYGHYLTALTGYYGLLTNPYFSWTPRTEAVSVLGVPVAVDYLDERKFAAAAAALARTASQTLDLTYRQAYVASNTPNWASLRDGKTNASTGIVRAWGVDEWSCRGGQGAYFNWAAGNSLLPAKDPNSNHQGIQIIDRTTVPELNEIVTSAGAIQTTLDNADNGANPLGLSKGALSFDISPSEVDAGKTHYEQIYARATAALNNAATAFNSATASTQLLRQQDDSVSNERNVITQQEQAYTNQLIELYGTPYTDDIGPGKTYVQGYTGPDLIHSASIDMPEIFLSDSANASYLKQTTYTLNADDKLVNNNSGTFNVASTGTVTQVSSLLITYTLDAIGDFVKPTAWTGHRASPGKVQTLVSETFLARQNLSHALKDYSGLVGTMKQQIDLYQAAVDTRNSIVTANANNVNVIRPLQVANAALNNSINSLSSLTDTSLEVGDAIAEFFPSEAGLASDFTSAARGVTKLVASAVATGLRTISVGLQSAIYSNQQAITDYNNALAVSIEAANWNYQNKQLLYGLQSSLASLLDRQTAVDTALRRLDQAQRDLTAAQALGQRIQQERQTFRQHAAALVQGYRVRDFAFRAFRDEALENYKTLFDLAARYTFLAARAYDYETGLLDPSGNSTSATYYQKIVQSGAIGVVSGGQPQFGSSSTGDPGLSGVLAQMNGDWAVAKTRLGFNNPDRYSTTFSLRQEKFRMVPGTDGDALWKNMLNQATMTNILDDPDVKRYALQAGDPNGLAVPGIVIPFETTITTGLNFFGQPLAGGDHGFTPSSFATKIRSSGVAFTGYVGMDAPKTNQASLSGIGVRSPSDPVTTYAVPTALSATPYIYLIPAGTDSMRSPLGGQDAVRTWAVEDQAIPLPFNIGGNDLASNPGYVSGNSLSEPITLLRKQQAFRAVPDGTNFPGTSTYANSRLIGRSAWNSRWKIVIPGTTLLSDPNKGVQTFVGEVTDIKLHLETYSYSGN